MSDAVTRTLRKTFSVPPGGRLQLRTDRGSIKIDAVQREDVEVEVFREVRTSDPREAERVLDAAEVEFSADGSELRLNARWELAEGGPEVALRFSIALPSRFHLDLATRGGDVVVSDIEGDVTAVTSGGSLLLGRIRGRVQAEATGGNILVAGCSGEARLRSRGGRIRLDDAGDVVEAASQGGGISARLSAMPGKGGQLSAAGGSLEVLVPPSVGLEIEATAVGGRIQSDLPVAAVGPKGASFLAGGINGGGAKLSLRAVAGNVDLKTG